VLNYASPHEEEEEEESESQSSESSEANISAYQAVATTPESNADMLAVSTSQVILGAVNHQAIAVTSDAANQNVVATSDDANWWAKAQILETNPGAAKHQSEELDDISSTLSLDSTDACSESTSHTFYSPIASSCVTPEPKPSGPAITLALQSLESTETALQAPEVEHEIRPVESLGGSASLPASTQINDSSSLSGSASPLRDEDENTKGKSQFSNFFQIKKKPPYSQKM